MASSNVVYDGTEITAVTTAAVTGARFVDISGNKLGTIITTGQGIGLDSGATGGNIQVAHATAASRIFGVAREDAASGARVQVIARPGAIVQVTATGAITFGDRVEVGANGTVSVFSTGVVVGRAIASAADGALALIAIKV